MVVDRAGVVTELTAVIQAREDGTGFLGVSPTTEMRDLGLPQQVRLRGADHRQHGRPLISASG